MNQTLKKGLPTKNARFHHFLPSFSKQSRLNTIRPIFSTHLWPEFLNPHAKDKGHGSHYPQGAHGRFTMIAPLHAIQKGPLFWHYALLRKQLPSFTVPMHFCAFVWIFLKRPFHFFGNRDNGRNDYSEFTYGLLVWFIGRSFMCTNCCLC